MVKTQKTKFDLLVPSPSFTSADVAELTGVSLRQLQWGDEKKVVSPRQDGHRRLYLTEEVLEISVIAELRRKGFSLQKIRRVLRFLQRNIGKRLAEVLDVRSDLHLVTDGKSIYLEDNTHVIIDIFKNANQPLFLVSVSDQVRRIQGSLPAARKPVGRESAPPAAVSRKAR
ncbi:MAG: MerR family transcriptional regulator [Acidobacteriota bacterium]